MAYDDKRAFLGTFTLAAQNAVSTASGAIVAGGTTLSNIPVGESSYLASISAVVTATPTTPPAGVKPYVVIGTATTTGPTAFAQSSASSGVCVFNPPVALTSGGIIATVGLVCTGTASATETIGATTLILGFAPQFV